MKNLESRPTRTAAVTVTTLTAAALCLGLSGCGGGLDTADTSEAGASAGEATAGDTAAFDLRALDPQEQALATQLGDGASEAQRYIVTLNPAALPGSGAEGRKSALSSDDPELAAAGLKPGSAGMTRAQAVVQQVARGLMAGHQATLLRSYGHAMHGFAVQVPKTQAEPFTAALSRDPRVLAIERDRPVRSLAVARPAADFWGLDRIDQAKLPLSGWYTPLQEGRGVRIYVVDSGVNAHQQFGDRLAEGYDAVGDGRGTADCTGHGTHVAGVAAGSSIGVAPAAEVVPVRVITCAGSSWGSSVLDGLDWIVAHGVRPAVVNLSLGGAASSAMDNAVARLTAAGFVVVAAAGNDNRDACSYSPARASSAITVGATDALDYRASFSNLGRCLKVFAPGVDIRSASFSDAQGLVVMNGTSMAAPHVSGAAAQLLQVRPRLLPSQVATQLTSQATASQVKSAGSGSPNKLLFVGEAKQVTFPTAYDIHVQGLQTSARSSGKTTWTASVTVAILQDEGQPIKGVKVTGLFSNSTSVRSCTTNAEGRCTLNSATLKKDLGSVGFAVSALAGTALTYRAQDDVVNRATIVMP